MTQSLIDDLATALEYVLTTHYDPHFMLPGQGAEERERFKGEAYHKAMAALKRKAREAGPTIPPVVSKLAAIRAEREVSMDIREEMKVEQGEVRDRMVKGLDRIAAWSTLTDDQRQAAGLTFLRLAQRYVDLAFWLGRPLPTTSVCVCSRPSCRTIVWPSFPGGGYRCKCGLVWSSAPVSRPTPQVLPENVWTKYRPGMQYRGLVEMQIDGRGRPVKGDPYAVTGSSLEEMEAS